MELEKEQLEQLLNKNKEELKIHEFGIIKTTDLVFTEEVREICKNGGCGRFNTCWSCPPAVGSLESCKEKILEYEYALIFTTLHTMEDSFDVEGMMESNDRHDKISRKIRSFFESELDGFLMLSSEGCSSCQKCTYPDEPCRFPEIMSPSVESYGIIVSEEAKVANVKYINGVNTITLFGNVFFD